MTGSARRSLRSTDDLLRAGLIDQPRQAVTEEVGRRYAIAITPAVADLIAKEGPDGPIGRQFLPSPSELVTREEERADPIGDGAHSPVPGVVHRYPDRVLLKLVQTCPVYCRFCFRREMVGPGKGNVLDGEAMSAALDYMRARAEIFEVILTGGDPLVLSPRRIAAVAEAVGTIPHIEVMRWHTRVPIVEPERVTGELVSALSVGGKTVVVAIHANHPDEMTPAASAAISRLADAGILLLSQTVLLNGVNDDVAVLERLMRSFVRHRIKPYYLHHLDLAPGTSHFRLSLESGREIYAELIRRVSGICRPAYVLDIPGGFGKVPIAAAHILDGEGGRHIALDPAGGRHVYPPISGE